MELQEFVDYVEDPVLVLDGRTVRAINGPAGELLRVEDDGHAVGDLFGADPDLADQYADALEHYPDVGGVIEGDRRHFDPDHTTVESLLEGREFASTDPDFGVFVDGDLRYFHARRSDVSDTPGDGDSMVVLREISDMKDHEQDLDFLRQVVTRILRHNLRNNLMVARGYAESLEAHDDESVAEMGTEIRTVCEDLLETGEKARAIQRTVEAEAPEPFDVDRVVEDAVDSVAEEHGGEFEVDVPSLRVEVNPQFPEAVEDSIENGIVYDESDSPRVEVRAERDGPWVVLTVEDDGPGIPQAELDALVHRGETELVHGSGAGLWLTHTVVEESGGDVTYEADDSGTTVRMRLPAAE